MTERALLYAFSLWLAVTAIAFPTMADEYQLADRFQIPSQGHMKIHHGLSQEFRTKPIQSEADLLALHRQIANVPFDKEAITSWEFLEQAGMKRIEPIAGSNPLDSKRLNVWRVATIDFDRERFAQREGFDQFEIVQVETPVSNVNVSRHPMYTQINHSNPLRKTVVRRFDVDQVLSRSARLLDEPFDVDMRHGRQLIEFSLEKVFWKLAAHPDRDLIEARLSESKNRRGIFNFTLHWYHQPPASKNGMWIPKLTARFSRTKTPMYPGDKATYRVEAYIIEEADFDKEVNADAFLVPIHHGETYVHTDGSNRDVMRVPSYVKDIANSSPGTVIERMKIEAENQRNGRF